MRNTVLTDLPALNGAGVLSASWLLRRSPHAACVLFQGPRPGAASSCSPDAERQPRDCGGRRTGMQCSPCIHTARARMTFPISSALASVCRYRLVQVVWAAVGRLVRLLR